MIARAILTLSFLLALPAFGESPQVLVQPKGSSLKLAKLERDTDLVAAFDGQISVTGALIARWIRAGGAGVQNIPEILLVPDPKSRNVLPYFKIKDPPHVLTYKVRIIEIQNGPEALRMAVGAEKAERLIKGTVKTLKVTGSFILEKYSVGVECDAPWARAVVAKANVPDPFKIASAKIPEGC
jgi:hypothetical protein